MGIEVKNFRRFQKGTLLGFGDILLPAAGIEVHDVTFHQKNGEKWVGLPSKSYQDDEGNKKYSPYIRFPDKKRWETFQREAVRSFTEYLEMNQVPKHDESKEAQASF